MSVLLSKSSNNIIAIFTTPSDATLIPLVLSTGVGVNNFIEFDPAPNSATTFATINGSMPSWTNNIVITGTMTFHPASLALIGIQSITSYQQETGDPVRGTLSITNIPAGLQETFYNFVFNTLIAGTSSNRKLEDVKIKFSCSPPKRISIGGLVSLAGSVL